jgi:hypothetical protein
MFPSRPAGNGGSRVVSYETDTRRLVRPGRLDFDDPRAALAFDAQHVLLNVGEAALMDGLCGDRRPLKNGLGFPGSPKKSERALIKPERKSSPEDWFGEKTVTRRY